jgi:hypothetical protein
MMMVVAVRFGFALTVVSELAIGVLLILFAETGPSQIAPAKKPPGWKLWQISSRVIDPNQFEYHSHDSLVPTVMNGQPPDG